MTEAPTFAIVTTAYNRPELLLNLLESIAKADDIHKWKVYIGIDPSDCLEQNVAAIKQYQDRLNIEFAINTEKKGVRLNPFATLDNTFSQATDYILLLEDDLTISKDALTACHKLAQEKLNQPNILAANLLMTTCCSESIFEPVDPAEYSALANIFIETHFFSSCGLLISKKQWEKYFKANWFTDEPLMVDWRGNKAVGWDMAMNRLLLMSPQLKVIQSLIPRVNHHGRIGTHVTSSFQERSFDNISLEKFDVPVLENILLIDPFLEIERIPSAQARLYINLCKHLWTSQIGRASCRERV